ncbi:OsmC family protein [uncultured Sulfitobacter sp.]|uniref:OsmC family protein n=1 Tax=uncultured Sulfitobacter sp. TaxID=191468 RepID=UPI00261F1991|nr:OsmC family protein [uncultured Sulfitobacter sp.]
MGDAVHRAVVEWSLDGGYFSKGRYSRSHLWSFDGGARVPASASPHIVREPFADPKNVDPEEAYIAALSACHMLWFLDIARQAGHVVLTYHDCAEGVMAGNATGNQWVSTVTLRPQVQWAGNGPAPDALTTLHAEAHARCYLANSVRTRIQIEPR